jgi:putative endonuclease
MTVEGVIPVYSPSFLRKQESLKKICYNNSMSKTPAVYIITNKKHGTLYIGVTSNLTARIYQHKNHLIDGFSKKYNLDKLVYFEVHTNMYEAITREKALKKWKREWKIELIEKTNSNWMDLYEQIL